ncbi:DMT family transporter [Saccharopolyspora sp. MS10]|uniref:DMT family transporter n=1 Tax=Saccharopolyspora sp. MS10 TaxID=3385973 RepID=UPI00399F530C
MLAVAVPAAVLGAAGFGLASAVQQRATKQVPTSRTLDPRLLWDLVRKPIWLLSIGTVLAGLSLQVVALAFGPLILVQPLLVTSVLFAAVFAAGMAHRRLDRVLVLGALAVIAGLAAFLLLARPVGEGTGFTGGSDVRPLAAVLAVLVVICVLTAHRFPGEIRVLALAMATGVLYGVTAGLIKVVAEQIRVGGLVEPFTHATLYVVCALGPVGFLLSQNTFQQGRFISPALAVITAVDPLVGMAIGVSWLGERIVVTPLAVTGQVLAAIVLMAGIWVLTHRGEHLRRVAEARSG